MRYKDNDHILLTGFCDCECFNPLGSGNQGGVDRPGNNSGSMCISSRGSAHSRFAVFSSMRFVLLSKGSALQSREDQNETHCDHYDPQIAKSPSVRCDNSNFERDCLGWGIGCIILYFLKAVKT